MTVKELKERAHNDTLIVKSSYGGRILITTYDSKKHQKTIGNYEVREIWSDIKIYEKIMTQSSIQSVICRLVYEDIESGRNEECREQK